MKCEGCGSNFRTADTPPNVNRTCYRCGHDNGKAIEGVPCKSCKGQMKYDPKVYAGGFYCPNLDCSAGQEV